MNARALTAALVIPALILLVAGPRAAAAAATRRAAVTHAAKAPALPDTVLARLFFQPSGTSEIGLTRFREGAQKVQSNADSLTPPERRELLGVLIQQAMLDHAIAIDPPHWLHRDSTNFASFTDLLTLRAALDSALEVTRAQRQARGDSTGTRRDLISASRDAALAHEDVFYDTAALDTLAAAFATLPQVDASTLSSRRHDILMIIPAVSARDSASVLARFSAGSYTTGEFLRDRSQTTLLNRPLIGSVKDLRAAVDDVLYTMVLRREIQRRRLDQRPDIAAQLASRRQFLNAQRYVQTHAYDRVPVDSATVRVWFDRDPRRWDLPATASVVRVLSDRRGAVDSAAAHLASAAWAESVSTQNVKPGVPYLSTLTEDADTVLFARASSAGVGGVVGPDRIPEGWRVLRVMSTAPRRPQTFEESFVRVRANWLEADGDRRMREMMNALAGRCRVVTNETSSYLTGQKRAPR